MKTGATKQYPFLFSIVSAVWGAEDYLDEFAESIFSQTIGFEEHVQLILVDDGSPDRSGEICDRLAARYPKNVTVLHQENGGVSAARNAGLSLVEGKYVNFCDPDDILTPNTLEAVYTFFEAHDGETDVVSIPIMLFGSVSGPHLLNGKFSKGSRVIFLQKECSVMQLSSASAFFVADAIPKRGFRTELTIAEDAELIMQILIRKPYLGVVAEGEYRYRRHEASALSNSTGKKEWYLPSLRYFSMAVMDAAVEHYGYLPRFVQNVVAYDLQWKVSAQGVPSMLTEEEFAEYRQLLKTVLDRLDEDVILQQKSISLYLKLAILADRAHTSPFLQVSSRNIYYGEDYRNAHAFSRNICEWSFLEMDRETVRLSYRQLFSTFGPAPEEVWLTVNDTVVPPSESSFADHQKSLGTTASRYQIASFSISKELLKAEKAILRLHTRIGNTEILMETTRPGTWFPVTTRVPMAYYAKDGLMFVFEGGQLCILPVDRRAVRKREKEYRRALWKSDKLGAKKAALARVLLGLYRATHKKPVWILSDRLNRSGDNGEAFFRYLKSINYKGAKYYYAINRGADFDAIKPLGNVIDHASWKYKLLYLAAEKTISAHADDVVLNPFDNYAYLYQDILRTKDFIFLQHGVIESDISGWLNRYNKNIRGFICSAYPEYQSIIETPSYFYTPNEVWLTGLPRFDRLYHDEKKYLTLMPTWRKKLAVGMDRESGVWKLSQDFCKSDYFLFYNQLLNHPRLLAAAREHGYTICYFPHPNIMPALHLFDHHPEVKFFTPQDAYRDVYAWSNLVLTDYSSAAFDFAYLRKPVVYAQFDHDDFFSGSHVATKGYFEAERDGFGEVTYDLESTVDLLIDYMKNDCALKPMYRERIDNFFAFSDKDNCKRILERLLAEQ